MAFRYVGADIARDRQERDMSKDPAPEGGMDGKALAKPAVLPVEGALFANHSTCQRFSCQRFEACSQ